MADIHFFVELDRLLDNTIYPNFGQGIDESYGPVNSTSTSEYRVTSMFKLQQDSIAYAATSGLVLVQPQYDEITQNYSDTRVNLILKPFLSPNNGFTDVEFFIYRGLRKDSFLDSNDNLISQSTSNISNLMDEVWNDFLEAKQKNLVEPSNATVPSPNRIGLHIASEPSTIDLLNVFDENRVNQTSNEPIQLAAVNKGWTIGEFDSSDKIGFEIILKDKLFTSTLETARIKEHIISAQNISTNDYPGDLSPEMMREREQILNFIDPCTYFSLFGEVDYMTSINPEVQKISGMIPISQILQKPFYTRKTIYLDIRNEFGYSLNYHKDNQGNKNVSSTNYGKHFKIMINQGVIHEENYYVNFWPIYTFTINNNTNITLNSVDLAFRTQYYPDQVVFVDYFDNSIDDNTPLLNSDRFLYGGTSNDPNYSEFYDSFYLINLVSPIGFSPSQIVKLIFARRTKLTGSLPVSSIPKGDYLDNLFGPLKPINPNSDTIVVERCLGKRYLDLRDILGIEVVVEVNIIADYYNVFFFANIIAYNAIRPIFKYIELSTMKFIKQNTISSNFTNVIKEAFSNVLEFSKLNLDIEGGSTINLPTYVFDSSQTDKRQFLFGVTLSKEQYNNKILPAASNLNSYLHDTYLNFVNFNKESGTSNNGRNIKYFDSLIRVSGFNNLGTYTELGPTGGNLLVYTFDKLFISSENNYFTDLIENNLTTNDAAYITLNDFINYVQIIESVYLNEDKDPNNNNISAINTSIRIRVHSYGKDGKSGLTGYFEGGALEKSLPDANYKVSLFDRRNLEESDLSKITNGKKVFYRITSNADENWFKDNPSPYIKINTNNQPLLRYVDLGQILYGFDSLTIPSINFPTIGYGYTSLANGYPIDIPYDLTGIIANIATPVSDALYHRIFGFSPITKMFINDVKFTPSTPDLFAYYIISAPDADLIANADAIGLSKAYNELVINANVKLSDVLKLYYKGINAGFALGGVEEFFTVERRWIILAKHFGLVKKIGNKYRWLPDSINPNDIQEWSVIKNGLKNRMYDFAEFWWNHYPGINAEKTLQRIVRNRKTYIERFQTVLSSSQLTMVNNDIETVLQNFFLPYVKNELLNEDQNLIE